MARHTRLDAARLREERAAASRKKEDARRRKARRPTDPYFSAWTDVPPPFEYTAAQIDRIGLERWEAMGERIQLAADTYRAEVKLSSGRTPGEENEAVDPLPLTRKEENKALRGLSQLVGDLAGRLSSPGDRVLEVIELWTRRRWGEEGISVAHRAMHELGGLAAEFEKAAIRSSAPGPGANIPRRRLIASLVEAWTDHYGERPTRSSRRASPFEEFAVACIEPIDRWETQGVRDVIREVLEAVGRSAQKRP